MVNRNLIREFDVSEDDWNAAIGEMAPDDASWLGGQDLDVNQIVEGKIIRIDDEYVLVDVGYKSEGMIPRNEWEPEDPDQPEVGQVIRVLVEDVEDSQGWLDDRGMIVLSKRKAEKIEKWLKVMETVHEGDVVSGLVTRKIKGGLLVDIGVNVFLPASQVDIRRPHDIGEYIGKTIECMVLKIDEARRNIVVSRRSLIESQRAEKKAELLKKLEVGQSRKGIVKNIADFGAFVDLGGIDGLLHITDMSWGRINHPSELVKIDDELEVMVLHIDYEKEKIALGLKQKQPSPWQNVAAKYPVGSVVKGTVVNVMSYGAFVKLEDGIEGLVHISEMSWTKRISHPSELVNIDDVIDVVVLRIDEQKQEISLGMKQTQNNPWEKVADRYPVGSKHTGEVVNIMSYGAFVKLEPGVEGLVHISEMSWTRRINHPTEVVQPGDQIEVMVLNINREKQEISLGMKQCLPNPWDKVAERYSPNTVVSGVVRNLTNYGAFIEIEEGIDGLLHVSDMSWTKKVSHPNEVVQKGQKVTCIVLNVDQERKRVALGLKQMATDPWEGDIPGRYPPGKLAKGKVTKITNFGVFVELEPGLEGLLHISELSDDKIENAEDLVKVGDEIEVRVLRVESKDRKIGLSRKKLDEPFVPETPEEAEAAKEREKEPKRELRGGTGQAGPLFQMPGAEEKKE